MPSLYFSGLVTVLEGGEGRGEGQPSQDGGNLRTQPHWHAVCMYRFPTIWTNSMIRIEDALEPRFPPKIVLGGSQLPPK